MDAPVISEPTGDDQQWKREIADALKAVARAVNVLESRQNG
jgi:hypothetical protein